MKSIEIRIPQLGEGLQEARLIRFLKQPGEEVAKDEPVFEMETDKAVMEIEAPASGVLEAWSAAEGEVLSIGAVIGRIAVRDGAGNEPRNLPPGPVGVPASLPQGGVPADGRAGQIPPRTRAYAREKGLTDQDLAALASSVDRVMPADVDRFLAQFATSGEGQPVTLSDARFTDAPLSAAQRTLIARLNHGAQRVVPGTLEVHMAWDGIEEARRRLRQRGVRRASQSLLFAWSVAQAARSHPKFRSELLGNDTRREYRHLNLGIAVARPGDELVMARIDAADALNFGEFTEAYTQAVLRARAGEDQASDTIQLTITNMAAQRVRRGIPVLVAPAVGTLFVGEAFDQAVVHEGGGVGFRRTAIVVFTFDHRIANGVGAASFLNAIRRRIENLPREFDIFPSV
ncbi:MAG: 2-oxo acid dehydrogenase subunit E2 [Chthonomonadales bacterium]